MLLAEQDIIEKRQVKEFIKFESELNIGEGTDDQV